MKRAAAILLLEAALFSASFDKFFCGDSLYYLSRRAVSWEQTLARFTTLDSLQSYRPLAYVVFDYLMYPLSGLDPRGYHAMMLAAHLTVSGLLFVLLRRLVANENAALAGMFLYGLHSVQFFLTYDATFVPDMLLGLCAVGSLLCWARRAGGGPVAWDIASLATLAAALLSKESAVMLPAGFFVISWLMRRGRAMRIPYAALGLSALYLAFQFWLRRGALYPQESGPYQLTLSPAPLFLKLKYLAWLANFPADWHRQGWWTIAPALLAIAPALWILLRLRDGWRAEARGILLCAGWAGVALAPVLAITQAPMKHNLLLSVLAISVALTVSLDRAESWRLERVGKAMATLLVAATGLQVWNDLRFSWVAEGSLVAARSLTALRAAYPALPRGAELYLLPAGVPGRIEWWFDGSGLVRLFYNDPTLQMRFADAGHSLPPRAGERADVFVFGFDIATQRIYDVTGDFRADARDVDSDRLLTRVAQAEVRSAMAWKIADLPPSGQPVYSTYLARSGRLREALILLPGTTIRFPLKNLSPDAVLVLGVALAGKRPSGSGVRVSLEAGATTPILLNAVLDEDLDGGSWWDAEADLTGLPTGGTLVVENTGEADCDWTAISLLRILPASSPFYRRNSAGGRTFAERGIRLLERLELAEWSFDRSEYYPRYDRFDTLTGKPFFLFWKTPQRSSLVTIAGARVRFALSALAPQARLAVSTTHAGQLGDGTRGRLYWESASGSARELLVDDMVYPNQYFWRDHDISLARFAGQSGALVFEASSGPARSTINDWFAWGKLAITSRPAR